MTFCMLYLCLSGSLAASQAGEALPPPGGVVPPMGSRAAADCPITLCDFARGFQPTPGNYEVLFVHPVKGCPVVVSSGRWLAGEPEKSPPRWAAFGVSAPLMNTPCRIRSP